MTGAVFVDTNVLIYSRDTSEAEKQKLAMAWMTHLWNTQQGRLSFQVLHEFYVTVTEKLRPGIERAAAREDVRLLLSWRPVAVDDRVVEGGWAIQDRYRLSWWDCLIVSAAQLTGCRYLLTEDLQEGQLFEQLRIIHPFRTKPDELA